MLRLLLAAGANANAAAASGATPLYIAAEGGHLEAVRVLLEAGADKEAATQVRQGAGCTTRRMGTVPGARGATGAYKVAHGEGCMVRTDPKGEGRCWGRWRSVVLGSPSAALNRFR